MDLDKILKYGVEQNASDVHFSSNEKPIIRIDGDLQRLEDQSVLSAEDLLKMLEKTFPEESVAELKDNGQADYGYEIPDVGRFRVNVFKERNGISASFRIIPLQVWTLEQLQSPEIYKKLCDYPNGLILVTGPTGSGKSTTLAAMVDYINQNKPCHIITIEDPVEFVYQSKKALVHQREVHHDTISFNAALRAVLREDPDIILVGEMRDPETIRLALTAAETGHLVFATLHTNSAAKSIDRIVDVFEAEEKNLIRSILADSLRAIIAQTLLKKEGGGRIAASEILICTSAIRTLIREGKIPQIYSAIQTGKVSGMRTLEQHLQELVAQKVVLKDAVENIKE